MIFELVLNQIPVRVKKHTRLCLKSTKRAYYEYNQSLLSVLCVVCQTVCEVSVYVVW